MRRRGCVGCLFWRGVLVPVDLTEFHGYPSLGVVSANACLGQPSKLVLRRLRSMRRIEQVRLSDWAVRTLVVVTFFAYFVAPGRWMFALTLFCFGVVGVWALLYPEGVLGWVKTRHPDLDVNDSSIWWVPRLVGALFLIFVIVLGLAFRAS